MSDDASDAIADYLTRGGQIVKGQDTVVATGAEVVDYLVSVGISARYVPGDLRSYVYEGKRYSIRKFVERANIHRKAHQLSPFAVKLNISAGGRRQPD